MPPTLNLTQSPAATDADAAKMAKAIDPRDLGTPDAWIPREPELIRLTGRHPFNCEPPLTALRSFETPAALHYVRNHGAVPRCDWATHTLEITGLVDDTRGPWRFGMDELLGVFAEDVHTLPVLLVCAGNRRKEQNMLQKTIGFSWGPGAAGTARWTGIPLVSLLRHCGVRAHEARFVWFEGADALPHGPYGTCIPAATALDPSCEVLVAFAMNGEALTPDHGFPVRLIVPGHIGGRMVKWLTRIHVSAVESTNHHHLHDNRVLPSDVDAQRAADENWWARPEFVIQELNINSIVIAPLHGEELVVGSDKDDGNQQSDSPGLGTYRLGGYAYSGGGRRVIRVELTLDGGRSWRQCALTSEHEPTSAGKIWWWTHFAVLVPVAELLRADELAVRAWDAAMNTQPESPTWNVMGMMHNPWYRVKIHRRADPRGQRRLLVFEHPTQAGSQKGGWMTADRLGSDGGDERAVKIDNASNQIADDADADDNELADLPLIPAAEVARHTTKESCWFICRGLVYDATAFLNDHPGGASSILLSAGTDCTDEFESIHSTKARAMLRTYRIGRCADVKPRDDDVASTTTTTESETDDSEDIALDGSRRVPIVLVSVQVVSHDARIFRFALPHKHQRLGLPVGKHVFLSAKIAGRTIVRPYTPISSNGPEDAGFVAFLIKIYFAGANPAFPHGGVFSQYLDKLHLGSRIDMRGPLGELMYHGHGRLEIGDETRTIRKLGCIAGGTGITPIFQLFRAIATDPADPTHVAVIYCATTPEDLLLREELEALQRQSPSRCGLFLTVTSFPAAAGQTVGEGIGHSRLTREMIHAHLGEDACHVAVCGPPGMIHEACLPMLAALGYDPAANVTVL